MVEAGGVTAREPCVSTGRDDHVKRIAGEEESLREYAAGVARRPVRSRSSTPLTRFDVAFLAKRRSSPRSGEGTPLFAGVVPYAESANNCGEPESARLQPTQARRPVDQAIGDGRVDSGHFGQAKQGLPGPLSLL